MLYQLTSIEEVIGRVIRNTRLQDTSYIADMNEWIPEAMMKMKTKFSLQPRWKDVVINFHKGKLPCGLDHITAVEFNGTRVPQATRSMNFELQNNASTIQAYSQQRSITISEEGNTVYQSTTISSTGCMCLPVCDGQFYDIEPGYIQTSMPDAIIRIHFKGVPLDENDLPLIPDNEDYKTAIYWYVRAMMIGAGYDDTVFSFDKCMAYYDVHAPRAINQIRYPAVDQMDMKVATLNRLFKVPGDYFNAFMNAGYNSNDMTVATTPMPVNKYTIIVD